MIEGYEIDDCGAIHQAKIGTLMEYNERYVQERYMGIPELCRQMAHLRLGVLRGVIGMGAESILDVGYGAGDFLAVASKDFARASGHDITGIAPPEGVAFAENIFAEHYDVVTFFDVLEHFEHPSIIEHLRCNYVMVSVPWCHYPSDDWFREWKHRRPDEHLWHWDEISLVHSMRVWGYNAITDPMAIEDTIRGRLDGRENILTMVFAKT
jgi:hypothetical protein